MTGVHGKRIGRLTVDTLDDVDFARVRPVGAKEPECRPRAAALWHMVEIKDNEAMVVGLLALEADAGSPATRSNTRVIGAHPHAASIGAVEAISLGSRLRNVVDVAVGGIDVLNRLVPARTGNISHSQCRS